jgi:hypothetical protein
MDTSAYFFRFLVSFFVPTVIPVAGSRDVEQMVLIVFDKCLGSDYSHQANSESSLAKMSPVGQGFRELPGRSSMKLYRRRHVLHCSHCSYEGENFWGPYPTIPADVTLECQILDHSRPYGQEVETFLAVNPSEQRSLHLLFK